MLARWIVIGFGVALVFPLLVYYGVAIVSSPPRYQELYPAAQSLTANAMPKQLKAYQDELYRRQQAFNRQAEAFSRILISGATPPGITAMLVGAYLPQQDIGTGLLLGGVLAVADGYWTCWRHLPDWRRFLSLLLGFVVLLFIGCRRTAVGAR
jgi:hypothetical protein